MQPSGFRSCFRQAFDAIWRVGLWSKLLKNNINGKILTVVKNMYNNIKACISINGEHSDYFQCHQGFKTGRKGVTDYVLSIPA